MDEKGTKTGECTYKQGQYSPRKRESTPRVNPQLAVELVYAEVKRIEGYTKRIEEATARKLQVDRAGLESAENSLKNVLSEFKQERYRRRDGGYIDKRVALWCILVTVFSLLFACFACWRWVETANERDVYRTYYEQNQPQRIK